MAKEPNKQIPGPAGDLARLAEDVNRLYELSKKADEEGHEFIRKGKKLLGTALSFAKEYGDKCRQLKSGVKHGQWEKFARDNLRGSDSIRTDYMQISERWNEIAPFVKKNKFLSIKSALGILRSSKPKPKPGSRDLRRARIGVFKGMSEAAIKFCAQHPDTIRREIEKIVQVELPRDQETRKQLKQVREGVMIAGHVNA